MHKINAILGDISFVEKFKRNPTIYDDPVLRIKTHLQYVHDKFITQTDKNKGILNCLQEYINGGIFPKHTEETMDGKPRFIDNNGNYCAVAHLMKKSGVPEEVLMTVNKSNEYKFIGEMNIGDKFLEKWAENYGLNVNDLACIQPGYPFGGFGRVPKPQPEPQPQLPPPPPHFAFKKIVQMNFDKFIESATPEKIDKMFKLLALLRINDYYLIDITKLIAEQLSGKSKETEIKNILVSIQAELSSIDNWNKKQNLKYLHNFDENTAIREDSYKYYIENSKVFENDETVIKFLKSLVSTSTVPETILSSIIMDKIIAIRNLRRKLI